MTSPATLAQLSSAQEMVFALIESVDDTTCRRQYHPALSPLGWYLGRCVFIECHWLRRVVLADAQFSPAVENLFTPGRTPLSQQGEALPHKEELLAWAKRWQDDNLARLANPRTLPQHPLLEGAYLQRFILQEYCRHYESMLQVLTERRLAAALPDLAIASPLRPIVPQGEAREMPRGHYRIGAADAPEAYDNELPPQAVELSAFRIATRPVSNSEYLAFMEAGGYAAREYWSEQGWEWLQHTGITAPNHWRRNRDREWLGVGVNGPYELAAEAPLSGISHHEASAFASWAASRGGPLAGACLPHEYQWEVARRLGYLDDTGRAWEWCSNPFHAYTGFRPHPAEEVSVPFFDGRHHALRGSSLHTRPPLRRPSFRGFEPPESRHLFSGMRLVLPAT